MQINPKTVLENKWLIPSPNSNPFRNDDEPDYGTKIAQNGIDCTLSEDLVLEPHSHKNVEIAERFRVPDNVIAFPFPRSSYSRKGIFISSGLYDSGFGFNREEGATGGVSFYNMSEETVVIPKGTRVLQFVYMTGEMYQPYNGHYSKTDNIESKL